MLSTCSGLSTNWAAICCALSASEALGAEGRGELALALRSYADLAGSTERGGRGKGDVVTFIRGGQVSEVAAR